MELPTFDSYKHLTTDRLDKIIGYF